MISFVQHRVVRVLAVLLMSLQTLLPGVAASAVSQGIDISRYMCTTTSEPSPEARAAASRLAQLIDEEEHDRDLVGDHCALCLIAAGVPLPTRITLCVPDRYSLATVFAVYNSGFAHKPQGPPTGSRAPPFSF